VGPIAVAFLQAALTMLQTELDTISAADRATDRATGPTAGAPPKDPGVA
jgi:hypothetical protein